MFVTINLENFGKIKEFFLIYRPFLLINENENESLKDEFKFLYLMHHLQKKFIETSKSNKNFDIKQEYDFLCKSLKIQNLLKDGTYIRFCGGNEFRCEKQNLVSDFGLRDNYITFENNKFNLEVFNKPEMILNTIGDIHYIQPNIDILEYLKNIEISENDYVYLFIENPEKKLKTLKEQNELIDLLVNKFYKHKNVDEFIFVLTKSEHIVNKMHYIQHSKEFRHPKHCLVVELQNDETLKHKF